MALKIKFTYDKETRRLVINDSTESPEKTKVFYLDEKHDQIFYYMLQAIDGLDDQGGGGGDGNVTGPDSAEDGHVAVFDGTTGKVIKDGGALPAQVQSDYDQNDSSASDYIKNRPFYSNSQVISDTIKGCTNIYIDDISSVITSGTLFDMEEDAVYNVSFNNTAYENLTVGKVDFTDPDPEYGATSILYVGNIGGAVLRTLNWGIIPSSVRDTLVETNVPFCFYSITSTGGTSYQAWIDEVELSDPQVLAITDVTDSSKTYTVTLSDFDNAREFYLRILPGDYEYNKNLFGLPKACIEGVKVPATYGEDSLESTWGFQSDEGYEVYLVTYATRDRNYMSVSVANDTRTQGGTYFNGAFISNEEGSGTNPVDISVTADSVKGIDAKFIPKAAGIAEGVTGFTTGDQVHTAVSEVFPNTPSNDGNYKLRLTVSSGEPFYSWVSDT